MSGLVLPGEPRKVDMRQWDVMDPGGKLEALHAGFHDLHRRLQKVEVENKSLAAQVNVVFELWAVVSTLVDVGPGRGKHGRRHFLARVEEAKRAINKVAAGGPRAESHAHQLLDAIKAMNDREAEALAKAMKQTAEVAKAKAEREAGAVEERPDQRTPDEKLDAVAAVATEVMNELERQNEAGEWVPEPGVLLGAAVAARAEQQDAGGEPLTRVRVEFKPRDAHRLALASEGFVLEGPGEESVGSVLLSVRRGS